MILEEAKYKAIILELWGVCVVECSALWEVPGSRLGMATTRLLSPDTVQSYPLIRLCYSFRSTLRPYRYRINNSITHRLFLAIAAAYEARYIPQTIIKSTLREGW